MKASGPAETRIDAYLAEVGTLLPGPQAATRRIIDELRDGLYEALDGRLRAGLPAELAADAAITQFGTPHTVAAAFTGELAIAYARRTLLGLLVTGPLVGACWLLALRLSPWRAGVIVLLAAVPVLPLVAVAVVLAVRTIATTGSLMRWLPETGPWPALAATAAVAASTILADLAIISRYLWVHTALSAAAVLALTASSIRIVACAVILHRIRTWPIRR